MHSLAMEPRELLRLLMERDGVNSNSLAARLGNKPSQPQIYKFLEGVSKEPRRPTLAPLAKHFKVALDAFYDPDVAERTALELELFNPKPAAVDLPEFEPIRPPTLAEALEALAMTFAGMDPLGREMASTLLGALPKSPEEVGKAIESLENLARVHGRPPTSPPPSAPKKKRASTAAERRPREKTALVLKIGGGQRQQFSLPLSRSAFKPESAPKNERDWYDQVRAVPKADKGR